MTAARDAARRTAKEAPATASARVPAIDVLRAFALFAMIGYHFAFDLRYFGVIRTDFEHDPFCLVVRGAILSSFLLLAGVSLVLADRAGVPPARFWRHVAEVAGCALLVSAGSYALFPKTFIWFGVLHAIAISLIVARPFARQPALAAAIGCAVIAAGTLLAHPAFDNRALGWIGFMTAKPYTEDYVPLVSVGRRRVRRHRTRSFPGAPELCADRRLEPRAAMARRARPAHAADLHDPPADPARRALARAAAHAATLTRSACAASPRCSWRSTPRRARAQRSPPSPAISAARRRTMSPGRCTSLPAAS